MGDKKQVWKQCTRVGYNMPPFKDSINSNNFVKGVKDQTHWMLKCSDVVVIKKIADPPSRKHVAEVVHHLMISGESKGEVEDSKLFNTAEAILKHPPQLQWLEQVLAYFDKDHDMFSPMYMPPVKEKHNPMALKVKNIDGFFSSDNVNPALLVQLMKSSNKRKRGMNLFSKAERH